VILAVFLIVGKLHNHYPPSKGEIQDFIAKTSLMMSQAEETLSAAKKMTEATVAMQSMLPTLVQQTKELNNKIIFLENRVQNLEHKK
jgi:hypothetical protein